MNMTLSATGHDCAESTARRAPKSPEPGPAASWPRLLVLLALSTLPKPADTASGRVATASDSYYRGCQSASMLHGLFAATTAAAAAAAAPPALPQAFMATVNTIATSCFVQCPSNCTGKNIVPSCPMPPNSFDTAQRAYNYATNFSWENKYEAGLKQNSSSITDCVSGMTFQLDPFRCVFSIQSHC